MEQLKLGKVSWRELSTWFGLSPDAITKAKPKAREKKLNILATYAKYHLDEVRNAKGGQFELFQTLLMDKLGFIPTKRTQLIDKEQGAF